MYININVININFNRLINLTITITMTLNLNIPANYHSSPYCFSTTPSPSSTINSGVS